MKNVEVRVHTIVDDNIEVLFVVDDQVAGSAKVMVNAGELGEIVISGDLDGDDRVDSSDEQIIKDIVMAFQKVKWS